MARTSKIQKKKNLQTTCPQSQTRAPMGSAVLFFFDFRGFCMVCFAVYCCYHIKLPFTLRNPCRTLQNLAKSKLAHLPPPHPPLSKLYKVLTLVLYCWFFSDDGPFLRHTKWSFLIGSEWPIYPRRDRSKLSVIGIARRLDWTLLIQKTATFQLL